MKHLQIEGIIEKRFEKLNAAFDNARLQLNEENIRVFRVKVKKLMACLNLIEVTTDHLHPVKDSQKMMRIYQLSGAVRTLQMQEILVLKTLNENQISPPDVYLKLVTEHILQSIASFNAQIKGPMPFKKQQIKLLELLPENVSQKKIQHFIRSEGERLTNLFGLVFPADKSFHELRKLLKNLLYISPYLDMEINELTSYKLLNNYDNLDSFTNLLGIFQDLKGAINCLHAICRKIEIDEDERAVLREIETLWIKESENVRKKIYLEIGKIAALAIPVDTTANQS